jgi:Uma2 family endonuclease
MPTSLATSGVSVEDLRRFTVEEYKRLGELGIIGDEERVELLDGLLLVMTPLGDEHEACVDNLNGILCARLGRRAQIRVQGSIALPRSRPQPDIAVLHRRADFYRAAKPRPADVALVIEVADTSLARDRNVKLPAYGRAGVAETWVVDLAGGAVIAGRSPGPDGYAVITPHERGERLTIPGFPDVALAVEEILGPPLSP